MGADSPKDRPPPPPPPDPPERRNDTPPMDGEGGGAPADGVEQHRAERPPAGHDGGAQQTGDAGLFAGEGGGPPPDRAEPAESPLTREQQFERWKEADAKVYSSQLARATPDQVAEMRQAAETELDHTLEQMQSTALRDDPSSDEAWRGAFDRNRIAQARLDMIGRHDQSESPEHDQGRAGGDAYSVQVDLRPVQQIEPARGTAAQRLEGPGAGNPQYERAGSELGETLSESSWRQGDLSARRAYTEGADRTIRQAYGLESRSPGWGDLGPSYGQFDPEAEAITYSDFVAELDDPAEAIKTAAHENRHAYQWEVVNDRLPEPEPGLRDRWTQAWSNYPSAPPDTWTAAEQDQYYNNPLEVDAREAEEAVYAAYLEIQRRNQR